MAPPYGTDTATGYWGTVTSTIDWCEENYVVTEYIAEFWNTISNLVMIIPPVFLAVLALRQKLEMRLLMCNISLLMVGVGSWCFHMTLLYSMQLLDELPMIWGTSFLVYSFAEISSPPGHQNRRLQIFLFIYCVVVTAVYLSIKNPVFHEFAYGLLVVSLVVFAMKVIRKCEHNLILVISGMSIYLFGFLLWNIDNNFCPRIRSVRWNLGTLGPISQLHAWWHLLAGIGTYLAIIFCIHTRYLYLKKDPSIKVKSSI
ncbi:alkaline ceramidase 3-like [Octopus bimaculoides]|uniref:alkaline ceramidase 3-like n=1 Tax=Octopus bimaculoides TaxID=37653 RepID=UPI0022E3D301|nr:alkaline ceramidase 3-like [Octopus bimaculoides]